MADERQQTPNTTPVLTFCVGDQTYAFLIDDVVEVSAIVELTTLPDMPAALLGLANRHGAVLPVLDFRVLLGMAPKSVDAQTLFVVVRHDDQNIGVVVDEVQGVEYLPFTKNFPTSLSGRYIRDIISIDDRLVQIVAVEPLVALSTVDDVENVEAKDSPS